MNDNELLKLLNSDPDKGMNTLIRQYSGLIFSIVRGRLAEKCDSSEIEDCVTDVFLKFRSGYNSYVPDASLKNYLAVIARNTALTYLKKKPETVPLDDEESFIDIPDDSDFTDEIANQKLLESIYGELERIGPPDSEIIIKKYYFGYSSKQIAEELGMTVSNVDVRAHRTVMKLRKKYGGQL